LATLLIDVGAPVKLTQEILRHANSRITLELYQQVTMTAKQELQAKVVAVW
jgi:site-specific recombinase XerD